MKKEIIGDKENNIIPIKKNSNNYDNVHCFAPLGKIIDIDDKVRCSIDDICNETNCFEKESDYSFKKSSAKKLKKSGCIGGFFKSIGSSIARIFSKKNLILIPNIIILKTK